MLHSLQAGAGFVNHDKSVLTSVSNGWFEGNNDSGQPRRDDLGACRPNPRRRNSHADKFGRISLHLRQ